ncbi:MAG: ADP-ribose pyrophosphatase YjhB (NUDIX family) [Polaribacter sp.]|jgi:ADP-ribose pyrophosphatase YjhB (NUDIX family)
MYKVFVNETPIIITSSLKKENNFPVYLFKEVIFKDLIQQLKNNFLTGIVLHSTDLEQDWEVFTKHLRVVPAAGGLVLNAKKEVLFIYRNDTWDLPKGKIEKGESIENAALREVEEECGISNISIDKKLLTTYHIYDQNGLHLKETHWFLMNSNYKKELIPQLEEGITQVVFKNKTEIEAAFQNTYANIKLVYDTYQET